MELILGRNMVHVEKIAVPGDVMHNRLRERHNNVECFVYLGNMCHRGIYYSHNVRYIQDGSVNLTTFEDITSIEFYFRGIWRMRRFLL